MDRLILGLQGNNPTANDYANLHTTIVQDLQKLHKFIPNYQEGGTIGVKWAILNSSGFPDLSAPGINPQLFGTIGNPTNFFSFSQMCVLLRLMIDEPSKPISLIDSSNSNDWLLEDTNIGNETYMPYLENKDLGCYIPSLNLYFRIKISIWGIGDNGNPGAITYARTTLYNPN
jgi:hypothetical protein